MAIRIGTLLLPMQPWADAAQAWRLAEQARVDVVYTADHLTHPTMPGAWWSDGWTTLAAAAQVTSSVELGTLVGAAGIRNPATLARVAATLQDVSRGRFVLGLGAGTAADVAADRGVTVTPRELGDRYAEVVDAVRRIWAGESDVPGQHVAASGLTFQPLPPDHGAPPLLLAAHGPRGLDLVARHADRWSTYGGPSVGGLPFGELWPALRAQSTALDAACDRTGRDPATVLRSVLVGYGPDRPLAGVDTFLDTVARAESAGFGELVVYWPVGEPGSRFWADPAVIADGVAQLRR